MKRLISVLCILLALACLLSACSKQAPRSITKSEIVNGELVLTYSDGTTENLGNVVGADGAKGDKGAIGATGTQGLQGQKGDTGATIKKVELDDQGRLVITLTDGTVLPPVEMPQKDEPLLATKHFEITVGMMSYAIYNEYQELVSTYDYYSQQFGITISIPGGKGGTTLNKSIPLREQIYATQDENGDPLTNPVTWFDHFAENALSSAKSSLALCEDAYDKGVQLTDAELQSIEMQLGALAADASHHGYTTEAYIVATYGNGVTQNDVRAMMKIEALASKHAQERADSFINGITDGQVQSEYDTNRDKYDVFVDYVGYTFTVVFFASNNADPDAAYEENVQNAAKYEAKKALYNSYLAELEEVAKTSPATFNAKLLEVLKEMLYEEEKEALLRTKGTGAALTAEEEATCAANAEAKANRELENAIVKNADTTASVMDTWFKLWVTDEYVARKEGDVYTNVVNEDAFGNVVDEWYPDNPTVADYMDSRSTYTVYLLNSGLKRNDGKLRSVAHVLFKLDTFQNLTDTQSLSGATKDLAERVLSKYGIVTAENMASELLALMLENGDLVQTTAGGKNYYTMDPAIFEAYGKQYTEDSSVFYDNVNQGQLPQSFEDWMFDAERVLDEIGIVESDYGYHVMLYRGDEKPAWSYTIRLSLSEGLYDAWYAELLSTTVYTNGASFLWNEIE